MLRPARLWVRLYKTEENHAGDLLGAWVGGERRIKGRRFHAEIEMQCARRGLRVRTAGRQQGNGDKQEQAERGTLGEARLAEHPRRL